MRIGPKRFRLFVEEIVSTQDSQGGTTENWQLRTKRWGSIEPATGREYQESGTTKADVTHVIKIRFCNGLVPKMRFNAGGTIYNIIDVLADKGTGLWEQTCTVKQVT